MTYGISLSGEATYREILSALEQMVHVAENEELVLAMVIDMRCCRCVSCLPAFLLLLTYVGNLLQQLLASEVLFILM